MSISFINPGEIDMASATILGINAKEGENPIGFFGTGIKYSIAVLLRNKQSLVIYSGLTKWVFSTKPIRIRGKDFSIIELRHNGQVEKLGFSIELGKNWSLQNVYRELWSNCMDEKGQVTPHAVAPRAGYTTIMAGGEEFDEVHANRGDFLLIPDKPTLYSKPNYAEVYPGSSEHIFYRGIAVYQLPRPSWFTYNILGGLALTEDRTVNSTWSMNDFIRNSFISLDEPLLAGPLTDKNFYEHDMDWQYHQYPKKFLETVDGLTYKHLMEMDRNLVARVSQLLGKAEQTKPSDPFPKEFEDLLIQAKDFLASAGYLINEEIIYYESMGMVAAHANKGKITLTRQCFRSPSYLVEVLLEEHFHILSSASDETREFQNYLIAEIFRQIRKNYEMVAQQAGSDNRPGREIHRVFLQGGSEEPEASAEKAIEAPGLIDEVSF